MLLIIAADTFSDMRWGEIIILSFIAAVVPAGILAFLLARLITIKTNSDLVVFAIAWFVGWVLIGIKLYRMQQEANKPGNTN